jgi:hypothetical protein
MEQLAKNVVPGGGEPSSGVPTVAVDVVFGVLSKTLSTLVSAGGPLQSLGEPLARVILRPPLVPSHLQPGTWLNRAARRGATYRSEVLVEVEEVLDLLIPAVVSELVRRVDLTKLVQQNVDLVALAEEVIAQIDLPAIIRDSTGAVASDTLLGVRMQSISGDEAIGRAVDRLRLRLGRRTATPRTT